MNLFWFLLCFAFLFFELQLFHVILVWYVSISLHIVFYIISIFHRLVIIALRYLFKWKQTPKSDFTSNYHSLSFVRSLNVSLMRLQLNHILIVSCEHFAQLQLPWVSFFSSSFFSIAPIHRYKSWFSHQFAHFNRFSITIQCKLFTNLMRIRREFVNFLQVNSNKIWCSLLVCLFYS